MKKHLLLSIAVLYLSGGNWLSAQDQVLNDSNAPLHLLSPDYKISYQELTIQDIKESLDRIQRLLASTTPTNVIDTKTNQVVSDYNKLTESCQLERGAFRLGSYEWGVTYTGMMEVALSTGDPNYIKYVENRFKFLSTVAPAFRKLLEAKKGDEVDPQIRQILLPHALDDAGAICASMIKYQIDHPDAGLRSLIDNYMDHIMNKQYRLSDGTFARNRPQKNTLWLDDMYMSIPAIVQMGRLTDDTKYYDEAVKQIIQFSERMFLKDKGLYMHGWVEGVDYHPAFHWGRANGWALLAMTEVLDVLPENYPGRDRVMEYYKAHMQGLAVLQSGEGFWHQLLDKNDSYLETSATAIYVYCIARAINKGWLNAVSYGPVAHLGWNAITTQITPEGYVTSVCVGTGMAFDPAFYYYRPVNVFAAHGYGPVLLAGSEMIRLIEKFYPRMNDSAIQYYTEEQKTTAPIFGVDGEEFN